MDLTGKRFGRLQVLWPAGRQTVGKASRLFYSCQCDCGTVVCVRSSNLTTGNTKSCGCINIERITELGRQSRPIHGYSRSRDGLPSRTYNSWCAMKKRCNNPNSSNYHLYGARGVTYDPRWEKFENFLEDMGERPKGMTLGRIDNEKGYFKENCAWETIEQQNNNKQNSRLITFEEQTMSIAQWAKKLGIHRNNILRRLDAGWSIEKTLTTPIRKKKRSCNS